MSPEGYDPIEESSFDDERMLRREEEIQERKLNTPKKKKGFRALREQAREDDEINLERLRAVRDNVESSPNEVIKAVERLIELGYDRPGARPTANDTSGRPRIHVELPKKQLERYRKTLLENA